jgi:predicted small metal-binding protein
MNKVIQCPCGFSIREQTDGALVQSAQTHAKTAHGLELTREQALAMAKPEISERRTSHDKGTTV